MASRKSRRQKQDKPDVPTIPRFTTPIVHALPHTGEAAGSDSRKQVLFLAAYSIDGLIGKAAKAAGCDRRSHTYWMATDPDYPAKFAEAQADANEVLEAECRRRAAEGMVRKKFYQGEPIIDPDTGEQYVEHEYSDRLLELALKAHLPDKYVDRQQVETKTVEDDDDPIMQDPEVRRAVLAAQARRHGIEEVPPTVAPG